MMVKNIKKTFLILPLLIFTFVIYSQPCPCEKHNPPPPEDPLEDPKHIKILENLRMWQLAEELDLSEEQENQIFPKLRKIRELKEKRKKEREKEIEKLSELLAKRAKGEEIKKQIDLIRNNDKNHQRECEKIQDEIFAIFTPEQQAKYLLFHYNFEGKIKKTLKRMRRWLKGF